MPQFDLFCFGNLLMLAGLILIFIFLIFKKEYTYRLTRFLKFRKELENFFYFITTVRPIPTLFSDLYLRSFFILTIKKDVRRLGRAKNFKNYYFKKLK